MSPRNQNEFDHNPRDARLQPKKMAISQEPQHEEQMYSSFEPHIESSEYGIGHSEGSDDARNDALMMTRFGRSIDALQEGTSPRHYWPKIRETELPDIEPLRAVVLMELSAAVTEIGKGYDKRPRRGGSLHDNCEEFDRVGGITVSEN